MLKLIIAAVAALVIGFTAKDQITSSGPGVEAAWEARAAEVDDYIANGATGNAHEKLSETGGELKDWLLERIRQKNR